MAIAPFLAMTAAEMRNISDLPQKTAWMACHFSPYGMGLSNLPQELPPNSLLILDDITPIRGHDLGTIIRQLSECVEALDCFGILLDFQRTDNPETAKLCKALTQALPCPTAVSESYGRDLSCPVFLPPVPLSMPLEDYLLPWKGREVWLEIGLDGELLTLTETGCTVATLNHPDLRAEGFAEEKLHCHYHVETEEKSARFTLWRTKEDMIQLLEEAETLGVIDTVGLYQEIATSLRSS